MATKTMRRTTIKPKIAPLFLAMRLSMIKEEVLFFMRINLASTLGL